MSEAKFTKGPWNAVFHTIPEDLLAKMKEKNIPIVRALDNEGRMPILAEDGESHIAMVTCHTPFKRGAGGSAECEVRDANALLLAAAPVMYRKLEEIYNNSTLLPESHRKEIAEILMAARGEQTE